MPPAPEASFSHVTGVRGEQGCKPGATEGAAQGSGEGVRRRCGTAGAQGRGPEVSRLAFTPTASSGLNACPFGGSPGRAAGALPAPRTRRPAALASCVRARGAETGGWLGWGERVPGLSAPTSGDGVPAAARGAQRPNLGCGARALLPRAL